MSTPSGGGKRRGGAKANPAALFRAKASEEAAAAKASADEAVKIASSLPGTPLPLSAPAREKDDVLKTPGDEAPTNRKLEITAVEYDAPIQILQEGPPVSIQEVEDRRELRRWKLNDRERAIYEDVKRLYSSTATTSTGLAEKDIRISARNKQASVSPRDLQTLQPSMWVNDFCIRTYLSILQARAVSMQRRYLYMDTFFWTHLSRGGQVQSDHLQYNYVENGCLDSLGVNPLCMEKIFIPMNINGYHYALAVVDLVQLSICYYDSMRTTNAMAYMNFIAQWLVDTARIQRLDIRVEDFGKTVCATPQQQNGYDCGVYCIMNADFLSDGLEPNIQPHETNEFRERIVVSLLTHCLKY